ncbi:hypothetical protein QFC22_006598 [Naganishia vaughanmartiniae]|uniref:Uncharacterized protein n=1 Tax=Naganishia vaughanmartiniae TaxID=1424756 RepID=A0ACC2WID1_9TREE|nr:hypothetical protein QFC22_006598 [Naganishia vaughanmartiniae]
MPELMAASTVEETQDLIESCYQEAISARTTAREVAHLPINLDLFYSFSTLILAVHTHWKAAANGSLMAVMKPLALACVEFADMLDHGRNGDWKNSASADKLESLKGALNTCLPHMLKLGGLSLSDVQSEIKAKAKGEGIWSMGTTASPPSGPSRVLCFYHGPLYPRRRRKRFEDFEVQHQR